MVSQPSEMVELFGEDTVQHLDSNLYRVRLSAIRLANAGLLAEDGKVVYGNPRWTKGPKGKLVARGIKGETGEIQKSETKKMEELRASIQEEGLENPLRVRPVQIDDKWVFEVINGERRFRSLADLCKRDVIAIDPFTREERPASEIYEWVHCRINEMDDETALQLSLRPNDTGEAIGDVASVEVVRTLRACSKSDEEILYLTGKSVTWLKETDSLLSLDDQTFQALQDEEINRKVALSLAKVEDIEVRQQRLEGVKQRALERWIAAKQKLAESIDEDQVAREIAEAEMVVAEFDEDEEGVQEAQEELESLEESLDKKQEELEDLEEEGPKGKGPDLQETSDDFKPLTQSKIQKRLYEPVMEIIECEDDDEDHEHLSIQLEIDIDDARLTQTILELIMGKLDASDTDAIKNILQKHFEAKMMK